MILAGLVAKNALRNKRRSVPTILSIGFSILLLTIMMLYGTASSSTTAPTFRLPSYYPDTRILQLRYADRLPAEDQGPTRRAGGRSVEYLQWRL